MRFPWPIKLIDDYDGGSRFLWNIRILNYITWYHKLENHNLRVYRFFLVIFYLELKNVMTNVIEIIDGKQAASRALLSVYLTLVSCFAYFMILKIEVTCSSEILVDNWMDYKAVYPRRSFGLQSATVSTVHYYAVFSSFAFPALN